MKKLHNPAFAEALESNLRECILPYWTEKMIDPAGGFYGRRDGFDRLDADAPKGAILNARILWTFAAAYNALQTPEYLEIASRAKDYILNYFIDIRYGGAFWSVNPDGSPADTKKQFYAIAFIIYGLSEYYRACGDEEALRVAMELFDCIELHSRDREKGGYIEAATREWKPIADMRLSEKDSNASKTMNTHLHIIEGYTALLRVTGDERVREATVALLRIFLDRIVDHETGHLNLFFNDDWVREDDTCSYGHDIEASWLLVETAEVIGDPQLLEETLAVCRKVADAALEGLNSDGSLIYERHADGHMDRELHWWVQAENVVGQMYLAAWHGEPAGLDGAMRTFDYITRKLVDPENGEWYWSRMPDGSINRRDDKAGFWKCPYHNGRACIEGLRLLS